MFVEYIAGVFKDKAKDGHCYAHQKPCTDSRAFHLDILRRYKGCLEALVKVIEDIETKEAPTWPAANPPLARPRRRPGEQPQRGHEGRKNSTGPVSPASWRFLSPGSLRQSFPGLRTRQESAP